MSKLTVKEHNGYYLASDGAWSMDGHYWLSPAGDYLGARAYRLALREYLDSKASPEASPEAEPEREVFTGDPKGWGRGVYQSIDKSVLVFVDRNGRYYGFGQSGVVFCDPYTHCRSGYHRISNNPLDAINPEMWEVE